MKKRPSLNFFICLLFLFFSCTQKEEAPIGDSQPLEQGDQTAYGKEGEQVQAPEIHYRISGPYAHENLALYFFHGEDRVKGKSFLTLQEALEQKKAIVHETGNVGKLCVENLSSDEEIFIQAGEIVKGGKQDRVLAYSTLIPPKSGKFPIQSFCVEQGRWRQRGDEPVACFNSSQNYVSSNELKLAVQRSASQQEVWQEVGNVQGMLASNTGAPVQASESATSLELTLDSEKVKKAVKAYVGKLAPLREKHRDIIGFAFAVNGKISSADVYASRDLFKKLWPKLLKACATEAVAKQERGKIMEAPSMEKLQAWLAEARNARARRQNVDTSVHMEIKESARNVMYGTLDNSIQERLMHLGYISTEK